MTIHDALQKMLTNSGPIPFVEFMHYALYDPVVGYYNTTLPKFGRDGDFVTAPELTPLFGRTLAKQCAEILSTPDASTIFEFGAGSGRLCIDILQQLETLNCLPDHYFILEVSAALRANQRLLIHEQIPHLASKVEWLIRWPSIPFSGVIIANEVFDAMPVHRFLRHKKTIHESFVTLNHHGELIESYQPSINTKLITYVNSHLPETLENYYSEANLFLDSWMKECSQRLHHGALFIIDYGFPRHEYYHPDRSHGTLMCHYRHHAHANPFIHVGKQDITAHVDFTHVAEAADAAGFCVAGYTNQASFLLACGLLDLLEQNRFLNGMNHQQFKCLIQPHEMGELFKVIGLTKQIHFPLVGFSLYDKKRYL